MPVAIKTPFTLGGVVSKYVSSRRARVQAQKQAQGTTSGPTGAEVDAHVASTLTRKQAARIPAFLEPDSIDSPTEQADEEGRVLGLEDPNEPSLVDDAHTAIRATAVPTVVATTPLTDAALLEQVANLTHGGQTSVPVFPAPTDVSTGVVDGNQYGFVDPRIYGGTSFDLVGNGEHEPLNVIISSLSSPAILTRKGFQSYCRSLDFDRECLGLHAGGAQKAYIDPRGWRDQEFLYRQVYTPLDHVFGTCIESLVGGNHIRAWQQQGSGAWFLATSKEMDASKNHMIVPDGYNVGRDILVSLAMGKGDGNTSFMGTRYHTDVTFVAGLMPPGMQGVNHDIAVDGLTAVLTVSIVSDGTWFWSKHQKEAEALLVQPPVAGGMVAAEEAEEDNKVRRKRLSFARIVRPNGEQHRDETARAKQGHVWGKIKQITKTHKAPQTEQPGEEAALHSSVDSGSTTADVAQLGVSTDTAKDAPTSSGILAAAPAIAP